MTFDPTSPYISLLCPDCKKRFDFPRRDIIWMLDAQKRNADLKIICPRCGEIETERVNNPPRRKRQ